MAITLPGPSPNTGSESSGTGICQPGALNSVQRPAQVAPAALLVLDCRQAYDHRQLVQRDRPLRLAVQIVERVPQAQGFFQEFSAAGIFCTAS